MLHHKVSDLRIRVSATTTASNPSCSALEAAPASNPSCSALEAAPASNPSGSSSMSSISSGYVSFQRFRLTEGVWAHNLLEYRRLCSSYH
jgi:hypothetical protein